MKRGVRIVQVVVLGNWVLGVAALGAQGAATRAESEVAKPAKVPAAAIHEVAPPAAQQAPAAASAAAAASSASSGLGSIAGAQIGGGCPAFGAVELPSMSNPAPGTKDDSVDSPQWTPNAADCAVPESVLRASNRLDQTIRALLERSPELFGVTAAEFAARAPSSCNQNLVLYRVSVASQMLGGGQR